MMDKTSALNFTKLSSFECKNLSQIKIIFDLVSFPK